MSGGARRVVVLRHGETEHNVARIWQGHLDTALSARGVEQAREAAPVLAALRPSRIVSSDLQRARVTAEHVARACGLVVRTDERFREIHVGAWQGMPADDVARGWPDTQAAVLRGEDVRRGEDGENLTEVAERVGEGVTEQLATLGPGECLVVSTHGAAGRALAAWLLGLDQGLAWRVLGGLGNCHWAELAEGRGGWRITTWNTSAGEGSSTRSHAGSSPA
ncbi:histidine phosphatase family protein [Fodinibacter luteus]|uniref:Histidine phosphatase family protein n=1 Tax=Fodinibacter luteus TaxID=552064 RepID=A0ABP8K7H4_9MICO